MVCLPGWRSEEQKLEIAVRPACPISKHTHPHPPAPHLRKKAQSGQQRSHTPFSPEGQWMCDIQLKVNTTEIWTCCGNSNFWKKNLPNESSGQQEENRKRKGESQGIQERRQLLELGESLPGAPDPIHTSRNPALQPDQRLLFGLTLSYIRFSSRGTTGNMVGHKAFISSERRRISPWKKPTRPPWQ